MKVGYKKLGLVLGAVAALALMPARADAQLVRYSPIFWSFDGGAGIAIPIGDLANVSSSGASFTLGASYFLNPRLALRADGGMSLLGEGSNTTIDPELQVWNFLGGIEYHLADPTGDLLFAFDLEAGGATFDSNIFTVSDYPTVGSTTSGNFSQTVFAAQGGLKLGYNFARYEETGVPMATIFINADFHLMFLSEDQTELIAAANGEQPFGTSMLLPITAGIRINIP